MREFHHTGRKAVRYLPQTHDRDDVAPWHNIVAMTRQYCDFHIIDTTCGLALDTRLMGSWDLRAEVGDQFNNPVGPFIDGDRCAVCYPVPVLA